VRTRGATDPYPHRPSRRIPPPTAHPPRKSAAPAPLAASHPSRPLAGSPGPARCESVPPGTGTTSHRAGSPPPAG